MTNSNTDFKVLMLNIFDWLLFGMKLYRSGVCDKRIDGAYKLIENCEIRGYTKTEAANLLNLSVRQFDRRVRKGFLPKGRKYKGVTALYWDKEYIDNMSHTAKK